MGTKSVRFSVSSLRPPKPETNPTILTPTSTVLEEMVGIYHKIGYQFKWAAIGDAAASLYVKYRIVESQGLGSSMWSVPVAFNQPFFDIYHRQTSSVLSLETAPRSWQKVATVADNVTPRLSAPWNGSVQYCIALTHPDNRPAPEEGLSATNLTLADLTTIKNDYVLFLSNPLATVSVV